MYTENYRLARIQQLVEKLRIVFDELYPEANEYHYSTVENLRHRLLTRDYYRPNGSDIAYDIKLAKRLTHLFVKLAIVHSPEWDYDRERRLRAYNAERKKILAENPKATFFSFEGSKYGKPSNKLRDYKKYFILAPEKDIEKAKESA